MKKEKRTKKILSVILSAALIASVFSSCAGKNGEADGKDDKGSGGSASGGSSVSANGERMIKMLYKNDRVALPDGMDNLSGMTVVGDKVYAVSMKYDYDEETGRDNSEYNFVVIDLDGNLVSKADITPKTEKPNENAYFNNMNISKDGALWVFEEHYFFDPSVMGSASDEAFLMSDVAAVETAAETEEAPAETEAVAENADGQDAEVVTDSEPVEGTEASNMEDEPATAAPEQSCVLKKISTDGSVLFELSAADTDWMSKFFGMEASAYMNYFLSDADGNIYLFGESYMGDGSSLTVVDKDGGLVFETKLEGAENVYASVNGACTGNDGKVYVMKYEYDNKENTSKNTLYYCDMTEKQLKQVEDFSISFNGYSLTDGSGDYLFYSFENSTICGYKSDGTCDELYNTINNGLDVNYVERFFTYGDGFIVMTEDWDMRSGQAKRELVKINKREDSEIKEKIEVTLSAYYLDNSIRSAVAEYNDSDGDFVITVTDYSKYNDYTTGNEEDYQAGYTRLKADIAAGNIADILCSPYDRSLASKGLYLDINTLIDSDGDFNRSDYNDRIFRECEVNGKLYCMPLGYSVQGYVSKKEYVPNDGAVSAEELESVLSSHEGMTLFSDTTREYYLSNVLTYGSQAFIDLEKNECSFNSPEFKKVLRDGADYPESIDRGDDYDYAEMEARYVTGKTLSSNVYIYNYTSLRYTTAQFGGGEISITGFPGLGTDPIIAISNSIMIYSKAAHPEAGWQLIKSALSEKSQNKMYSFPMNNKSREELAQSNIDSQYYTDKDGNKVLNDISYWINNQEVKIKPIDESTVAWINSIIDSCDVVMTQSAATVGDEFVMDIIKEEAAAYWAGTNSVETAAGNIQSRVSLYLSEQS